MDIIITGIEITAILASSEDDKEFKNDRDKSLSKIKNIISDEFSSQGVKNQVTVNLLNSNGEKLDYWVQQFYQFE